MPPTPLSPCSGPTRQPPSIVTENKEEFPPGGVSEETRRFMKNLYFDFFTEFLYSKKQGKSTRELRRARNKANEEGCMGKCPERPSPSPPAFVGTFPYNPLRFLYDGMKNLPLTDVRLVFHTGLVAEITAETRMH